MSSNVDTAVNYQWQINTGTGFSKISNNTNYTGATTKDLQLINIPSTWNGFRFRCLIDAVSSDIYTLQFSNSWTGAISSSWENAGNWNCGVVPDPNTDVRITTGTVIVNSDAVVRSLFVNSSVNITVLDNHTITILH